MTKRHYYPNPAGRCVRLNDDYIISIVRYKFSLYYMPKRKDHRIPRNGASLSKRKRTRLAHQHSARILRDPHLYWVFYRIWINNPLARRFYRSPRSYVFSLCEIALQHK